MKALQELIRNETGQGVAEYALILSGIVLLVLLVVYALGGRIAQFYDSVIRR